MTVSADRLWTGAAMLTGPVSVGVSGDRIAWVRAGAAAGSGLHFAGCTLMPALADAHVHYLLPGRDSGSAPVDPTAQITAGQLRHREAGVRAARDLGGAPPDTPQVATHTRYAGRPIAAREGGIDSSHRPRTPAEAAAAAEAEIDRGASVIKVFASDGIATGSPDHAAAEIDPAILRAVVSVAHERGVAVAAHSLGARACGIAIDAGVDTLEHGAWLTRSQAAEMAARGICLVPTLSIYRTVADEMSAAPGDPSFRARGRAAYEALRRSLAEALAARAPVIVGTDQGQSWNPVRSPVPELLALAELGMTAHDVLAAATSATADAVGVPGYSGRLVAGASADILVVPGNPGDDLTVLSKARVLLRGGELHVDAEAPEPTRG